MKNRKIEIRIEKRERIMFFRSPQQFCAQCRACRKETVFIAPEQAAAVFAISMREIFRLVEINRLHFIETETKAAFVCLTSLENLTSDPPLLLLLDDRGDF